MIVASSRIRRRLAAALVLAAAGTLTARVLAQPPVAPRSTSTPGSKGFDDYMAQVMKDWNAPGIGVGIVVKDKLVFAKGYGFRDFGNKLPYTPTTTQPIASNSKLFTAVASGCSSRRASSAGTSRSSGSFPVSGSTTTSSTARSRSATCCRTGRASPATTPSGTSPRSTRRELWDRSALPRARRPDPHDLPLQQLDVYRRRPGHRGVERADLGAVRQAPDLRPAGHVALHPDDRRQPQGPEPAVPYSERRDNTELYRQPYYTAEVAIAPAGAINSSVQDLSRWVIALLNGGAVDGKPVIPNAVIKETMSPSLAMPNAALESRGWGENLNQYTAWAAGFPRTGVTCWRSTAATCLDFTRRSRSCPTIPSA